MVNNLNDASYYINHMTSPPLTDNQQPNGGEVGKVAINILINQPPPSSNIFKAKKGRFKSYFNINVNNLLKKIGNCIFLIFKEPAELKRMKSYVKIADQALDKIGTIERTMAYSKWTKKEYNNLRRGEIKGDVPDLQNLKSFEEQFNIIQTQVNELKKYQKEYQISEKYQSSIEKKLIHQIDRLEKKLKILEFQLDILTKLVKYEEVLQNNRDSLQITKADNNLRNAMNKALPHFEQTKTNIEHLGFRGRTVGLLEHRRSELFGY